MLWGQNRIRYAKAKVDLSQTPIEQLMQLGIDVDHAIHAPHRFLIHAFSPRELSEMDGAGISYTILIDDLGQWYAERAQHNAVEKSATAGDCKDDIALPYPIPDNYTAGTMGGFHTWQQMQDMLDSMQVRYPDYISIKQPIDTFMTYEGRPIYWVRISDNPDMDEAEPEVLYTALHHAREPAALSQMLFYMWYLLENYGTDPLVTYLVDETELYFVPCINPDGYVFNEMTDPNGGGMWRKNRRPVGGGEYGVDLNRNYGYEWGHDNIGSSDNPYSETYRGPMPFSEPETQAIRYLCNQHQFMGALNYHTFGDLLIHAWGYTPQPCPDDSLFGILGDYLTELNGYRHGNGVETVGYMANGVSDDWMYGEQMTKPLIYSMTPEAGSPNDGFWPAPGDIVGINQENIPMNLRLAMFPHNFGQVKELTPGSLITELNDTLFLRLTKYGLANGDLTVQIEPITPNIFADPFSETYTLGLAESVDIEYLFGINMSIPFFEGIQFLVTIDNGVVVTTDTITKDFLGIPLTPVFTDDGEDISQWTNAGNWGISTNTFVSAPSSITDSPLGTYDPFSFSTLTSPDIDLSGATLAYLKFQAQWEIEPNYDYAQVLIRRVGGDFEPICGRYTKTGSDQQDEDEPLYDGQQSDWVTEVMDISDYAGDTVQIQFRMVSDGYFELDGFYVDDILVEYNGAPPTSIEDDWELGAVRLYPNPTNTFAMVELGNAALAQEGYTIHGMNVIGQTVWHRPLTSSQHRIETTHWNNGVYTIWLEGDGKRKLLGKLSVMR